jgi:hypothetical protein
LLINAARRRVEDDPATDSGRAMTVPASGIKRAIFFNCQTAG